MITGQRILLIEDNPILWMVFRESLEVMGYAVTECADASNAIESWDSAPADFVITDLSLGEEISGLEVVNFIHRRSPEVGIVMISGVSERPANLRPEVGFLHKPFTDAALSAALKKARVETSRP